MYMFPLIFFFLNLTKCTNDMQQFAYYQSIRRYFLVIQFSRGLNLTPQLKDECAWLRGEVQISSLFYFIFIMNLVFQFVMVFKILSYVRRIVTALRVNDQSYGFRPMDFGNFKKPTKGLKTHKINKNQNVSYIQKLQIVDGRRLFMY